MNTEDEKRLIDLADELRQMAEYTDVAFQQPQADAMSLAYNSAADKVEQLVQEG